MSCVPVTPAMAQLLEQLKAGHGIEELRHTAEWAQARAWGWVIESGELTGTGWSHADELAGGIVTE